MASICWRKLKFRTNLGIGSPITAVQVYLDLKLSMSEADKLPGI